MNKKYILLSLLILFSSSSCIKHYPTLQTASVEEDMYGVSIQIPLGPKKGMSNKEYFLTFAEISFEYLKKTSNRSNLSIMLYPQGVIGLALKCNYKYKLNDDSEKIDYAVNPSLDLALSCLSGISMGADVIASNKGDNNKLYGGIKCFKGTLWSVAGGSQHIGGYGPFFGIVNLAPTTKNYFEYFHIKQLKYSYGYIDNGFAYKYAYPK